MLRQEFVQKYKYKVFGLSFATVIFSSIIANMLFKAQSDLIVLFLITLMLTPLIFYTIKIEEKFDYKGNSEKLDIKHHSSIIKLYLLIFLGSFLGFLLIYLISPPEIFSSIFKLQLSSMGSSLSFNSFNTAFFSIFLNNLKVLLFCVFLSLFYGTGSLFIMMWNSSFLAIVFGEIIKQSTTFLNTSLSLFSYFSFGIFEIISYFVGGLAGGIVAIAIIKHHYKSKKFYFVLRDASFLLLISIILLGVSAFIESILIL